MRKILITGGAGFIGGHLAAHLLTNADNEIVLVDNLQRGTIDADLQAVLQSPRVTFFNLDLTSQESFAKLGGGYTHVYHLAAINGTKNFYQKPHEVLRVNTLSLVFLLEWLVKNNKDAKLCFTSSNEAYAGALESFNQLPIPTPEAVPLVISDPYNPRWSYAATKLIGELFVAHYAQQYGLRAVIVRPHNFYGPRGGFDHVIPEFLDRIEERVDPFPLFGAYNTRTFCYIADAVRAMQMLMDSPRTDTLPVETVHIGGTEEISMADLANRLFYITGWAPQSFDVKEAPEGSVLRRLADISKIQSLVGWQPEVSLTEGLQKTYEWYKAHPRFKKFPEQIGVGCFDISDTEKRYVNDVLNTGRISYGPYLKRFEQEFAQAHGMRFATMVNSGTSALEMAVACLKEVHNWQDGDEVLCPAITFVASGNVILANNLVPVFVDVDPHTYNIDPKKIEAQITSRTRAIMVVHLFGQPAAMDEIMTIARRHNLRVIEDSCETMFATYQGRPVGSFGDIGCFSTYVAHILVTGVGGLAVTDNPKYAEILRSLANHGRDNIYIAIDDDKNTSGERLKEIIARRYRFIRRGYSYRVTEMEGALGCGQFERRAEIIAARKANAVYFKKHLAEFSSHLQLPWNPEHADHVYMMFPILIKEDSPVEKAELVNFLEEYNIETRDMMPIINQPFYVAQFGDLESKYPVARHINRKGFYIACHQGLTEAQRAHIVSAFKVFFASR